jgi:DNA replication and repair protein RecF
LLLRAVELIDFRNYAALDLEVSPGVTVLIGANGQGKTNLLEAIAYLATLSSFRGATDDVLVRAGADTSIVRAEAERDRRNLLIETEIRRVGRNRTLVNRQPLQRTRDLLGALRVSVFAPDDLELVKGTPGLRRRFVDDLAVSVDPNLDARRSEVDRVLRQRNALLKQCKGHLDADAAVTLEVWDTKLASAGEALGRMRAELVAQVAPFLDDAYAALSGRAGAAVTSDATIRYAPSWSVDGLAAALAAARHDDLRRGVTTVGPHRDEIDLFLGGEPARTHASQGEQRSFALALRLAGHRLVTDATSSAPILLLDDVFSELDASRRTSLLANLPAGQTLMTTAADVPAGARPDLVLRVARGTIEA